MTAGAAELHNALHHKEIPARTEFFDDGGARLLTGVGTLLTVWACGCVDGEP